MRTTTTIPTVGLLSVPRYFNYGSQLQLFALQQTIMRLGYTCEVIDYDPLPYTPLTATERAVRLLRGPSVVAAGLTRRLRSSYRRHVSAPRQRLFESFLRDHIKLGQQHYESLEAIEASPPDYTAYVVGSDQVWSPTGHFGDRAYFLSFAPRAKRIAYAPSIGVSELPPHTHEWFSSQLEGILYLSVREDTAAKVISDLTGRMPNVVVDPTLLLSTVDWLRIAVPHQRHKPYVLCYALAKDGYVQTQALALARRLKAELVILPTHDAVIKGRGRKLYSVGPREFLGLIHGASYVCTDSLHGTILSIVFRRSFLSFRRCDNPVEAGKFARISDLMARLGLTDRIATTSTAPTHADIDYCSVGAKLGPWQAASLQYLSSSLQHATTT
jgi:hypothetical protein